MSTFLRSTRLAAAVSLVLASQVAFAAATPDPLPTIDLDGLVVTSAAPVTPLTWSTDPRLPRQPVPASDGADYLKTIPGFSAIRNGGSNGDPVLRGMFGSRLNLLTNEGAMPGACPSRMDNPMSYVSPETYDRLIVVKGPQTVLWGPGASAGTVRFVREPTYFAEPGVELDASLLAGSHGRNDQVLDATAGTSLGYARLTANRSDADDYSDGNGDRVPSSWYKWNVDTALAWTPDADTVLELGIGTGDGEARYAGRGMDGARFRRDSRTLRFEKRDIGGALEAFTASVFENTADHVMDNYSLRTPNPNGAMPMPMASNVERRTRGGRIAADWDLGTLQLTTGVDGQDSRHRRRNASGRGAYRALPFVTDATFSSLGAFAEATWTPAAGHSLVAGARADRSEVEDRRATAGMMGMPNPTHGQTREETLKAGFLRYERELSDPRLGWYVGVGHTERMPDYWELFSADRGPMGAANAFAGVATEKTTQLDLGLQYRTARVDAWVSAYAGRVDDFILFTYRSGGMMGSTSSVGNVDANVHGAEAGIELRPHPQWTLGGTLAWAWGEQRDADTPLPQMPPLEARLTAAWEGERWSAGVLLRGVASQDRVAAGQGNVTGRDLEASAGFGTLAINGGYRFDDKLRVTAGIDNLFDRQYSEHLNLAGNADFGYPADPVRIAEPGRTAWLKLAYSY